MFYISPLSDHFAGVFPAKIKDVKNMQMEKENIQKF